MNSPWYLACLKYHIIVVMNAQQPTVRALFLQAQEEVLWVQEDIQVYFFINYIDLFH